MPVPQRLTWDQPGVIGDVKKATPYESSSQGMLDASMVKRGSRLRLLRNKHRRR